MEEILIAILQAVFEFLLEVLTYFPVDLPVTRAEASAAPLALRCALYFAGGASLAGLSVLIFHSTLFHHAVLRIVNLVAAPLASAFLAQSVARRRLHRLRLQLRLPPDYRWAPGVLPREQFWQAFWFTLGVASVRFAFASR